MAARQELEALFLSHLGAIERIAGAICRRHGMAGDDAADFSSWVKLKLVENDYSVLGKFRGESALGTYLTVVIAMLARDYRVQRWGRWRPSAAARRRGRIAVQLETLVYRDGHPLDQAAEVLRTRGETLLSDRELATVFSELPVRSPLRPLEVGAEPLTAIPAPEITDDAERYQIDATLRGALNLLPAEDRVILRMRYWEAMSVADIARALSVEQKPLYRRIDRALGALRQQMEASGLSRQEALALIGEFDL